MFQPYSTRSISFLSRLFGPNPVRPKVFMDIKIEGQPKGRLVIEVLIETFQRSSNFSFLAIRSPRLLKTLEDYA